MKGAIFRTSLASIFAILVGVVHADDWPQFNGPNRDNISKETGLLKQWPEGGPKLLWSVKDLGIGYSGPAVVGDRVYVMGEKDEKQTVFCLNGIDGKEVWSASISSGYENGYGGGPRCTPTVDGKNLYVIGADGTLAALDNSAGTLLWKKNLLRDFAGKQMGNWGYAESPTIDGARLICAPGGPKGSFIALDKTTGELVWRTTELTDVASYSSFAISNAGGVKQYVNLTGQGLAGVAADDGRLLWRHRQNKYRVAVCTMPVPFGDHVFASADYNAGCDLLHVTSNGDGKVKMEAVYAEDAILQNHHGGLVLLNGHVYGCSGNSNGRCFWKCLEVLTKKEKWAFDNKLAAGSITCADGMLYLYTQDKATCVLLEPSTEGWKEHGKFSIPALSKIERGKGKIWTHPVIANGKLYLRDLDLFYCYEVKGT